MVAPMAGCFGSSKPPWAGSGPSENMRDKALAYFYLSDRDQRQETAKQCHLYFAAKSIS